MAQKILEVCKVLPPSDSPNEMDLSLTFFDLPRLILPPSELLLFYEAPRHMETFFSSILPNLKQTLSVTLQHFLHVAGNLLWPPSSPCPFIRYKKGDGISLTVAKSEADFYHISSKNFRESKTFRPLVPRIVGSGSQVPVIAIQITLIQNKGVCIGISAHHCLLDAKSVTLFMKAWASFNKFGENRFLRPELSLVCDRESIREQYAELERSCIEMLKRNGINQKIWVIPEFEPPPHIVRGTFELSGSDVKKLKEHVHAHLAKDKNGELNQIPYISTFAVAYAYVVICLVKAKGFTSKRVQVMFAFDCRSRLKPPVSANYFGNCVGPCATYLDTDDLLGRDGMMLIVNFISKGIKGLDDEALKGAEEWAPNLFKAVADTETMRIYVSGVSRSEFQSIDFGWGMPRKVDITSIDGTGGVTLTQGEDGGDGGIEIDLSLNKGEMEKFASVFCQGLRKIQHRLAAL